MSKAPVRVLRAFRYAVYFDGVDDYVDVKDIDVPALTLEAWAMLTASSWPSLGWRAILSKGFHTNVAGVGGLYVLSPTVYGGFLRDVYGNTYDVTASGLPSMLNTWHHIVLTSDGRLYVDGVLRKSVSIPNPVNLNDYRWQVGRDPIEVRLYPGGRISVARIYSRALSAEEVAHNYANPLNPVRNGLVLWLHAHPDNIKDVDGDGRLEWVDLSGFGNHGKMYGATLVEVVKSPARVLSPARVVPTV